MTQLTIRELGPIEPYAGARAGPTRGERKMHLKRVAVAVGFVVFAVAAGAAREALAVDYDWCAPIVVRPDQRLADTATCRSEWSDDEIAAGAEVVTVGDFTDVSSPVIPAPGRGCMPNPSHAANAVYVQRLRAARARVGGPPLRVVHLHRFDLVPAVYAALPGFDARMLSQTTKPWSQVTGFFDAARSAACATGCRWSDSWGGSTADVGRRIRDYIDASTGAGSFQRVVHYLVRPDGSHVYFPTAVIADLRSQSYRAWRVAEAREAIRVGGYDAIELNHKIHQYRGQHWIGSAAIPNVSAIDSTGDTYWTAQPTGYGYREYISGWSSLAAELRAAGVPYQVTISIRAWSGNSYDDPSTADYDEAEAIRGVIRSSVGALRSSSRYRASRRRVGAPASDCLRCKGVLQPDV